VACSGGSGGITDTSAANTTRDSTPIAANAVRHPATSPRNVPSGTPSTEPSGTAAKITAVARPTEAAGTRRGASPTPIDQNPPIVTPTAARETRIHT
jgi:hypothetical protein